MGSDIVLRGLGSVGFRNNSQIENLGSVGFKAPSRNVFLKFKTEPKNFFLFFQKSDEILENMNKIKRYFDS